MLVGVFVVGAIVLFVFAIMIFTSGKLLTEKQDFVLFFEGSVKGLNVGAPVTFRGVKVGTVTDVNIRLDPQTKEVYIPVYIEIEPQRFIAADDRQSSTRTGVSAPALVAQGLRAQLQLQSLLTGQLFIQFDFHPDTEASYVGAEPSLEELPTIPTPIQIIGKTLADYNVEEVLATLTSTLSGIDRLVNQPELREAVANLDTTLRNLDDLVRQLQHHTGTISAKTQLTLDEVRQAARSATETFAGVRRSVDEINPRVQDALTGVEQTLGQTRQTLDSAHGVVGEDSEVVYELRAMIEEMKNAANAVRSLADTLERQPEAVLRGKR
jgi:paraquat-inducible protein B